MRPWKPVRGARREQSRVRKKMRTPLSVLPSSPTVRPPFFFFLFSSLSSYTPSFFSPPPLLTLLSVDNCLSQPTGQSLFPNYPRSLFSLSPLLPLLSFFSPFLLFLSSHLIFVSHNTTGLNGLYVAIHSVFPSVPAQQRHSRYCHLSQWHARCQMLYQVTMTRHTPDGYIHIIY